MPVAPGTTGPTIKKATFSHNWDFGAFANYMQLGLSRTGTQNPEVWFVQLSVN